MVGPFRALGRGMMLFAVIGATGWLAGCASGGTLRPTGPGGSTGTGGSDPAEGDQREGMARSVVADSARAAVADGRWEIAEAIADSVVSQGAATPLSSREAVSFAGVLTDLGREDRAARLLLVHPDATATDDGVRELRRAAAGMSIGELEELERSVLSYSSDPRVAGVVGAELARAYALAGFEDDARRIARGWRDEEIDAEDRRTISDVLGSDGLQATAPVRVGVVLSLSGRFSQVGADLRDGIMLAFTEHGSRPAAGPIVDLIVVDDESQTGRTGAIMDSLETEGVSAVIGPIRSEALADAAASRNTAGLLVVSPTASRDSGNGPNAFSLWERDRKATAVGAALGRWFPEQMGLYRLGALYSADDAGRTGFQAFETAARESGAVITDSREFVPDSTTFEQPIGDVALSDPEGVVVLAGNAGTVLQIAPQLPYFGLRSRIIAGGEAWSDPEVLRRLEPAFADYRVVATFLDRSAPETEWTRFVESFEEEYQRSLPDNLLPALGYDAARLVLTGIDRGTLGRPGAISRSVVAGGGLDGATGMIGFSDAGLPVREVGVWMIMNQRLVPADQTALSEWAEAARAQEELMKQLEEEEEERKAAREAEVQ